MSIPLSAFDVSLVPGEPAALLRSQNPLPRDFSLVVASIRSETRLRGGACGEGA